MYIYEYLLFYIEKSAVLFDITEERSNLIDSIDPSIIEARNYMRKKLMTFLKEEALFGLGELRDHYLKAIGKKRGSDEEASNTSYRNAWEGIKNSRQAIKLLRKEEKKRRYKEKLQKKQEFIERKFEKLDDLSNKANNNNNNQIVVHNANPVGFKIRMGFNHGT